MMKFLSARWSNLFLATYTVPPEVLLPHVPTGLQLESVDGQSFVTLVAFDFLNTKVLGIPWPGFRNFPEINLRFYVRQGERRRVVFIGELVRSAFVAWLARKFYHEPYQAMLLSSAVTDSASGISVVYRLDSPGHMNMIRATGRKPADQPDPDSFEHFIKEHEWGFGKTRKGRTMIYRVEHPIWEIYPLDDWDIDWDWAGVYGPEWAFLQEENPCSIILAAGSKVSVFTGQELK